MLAVDGGIVVDSHGLQSKATEATAFHEVSSMSSAVAIGQMAPAKHTAARPPAPLPERVSSWDVLEDGGVVVEVHERATDVASLLLERDGETAPGSPATDQGEMLTVASKALHEEDGDWRVSF